MLNNIKIIEKLFARGNGMLECLKWVETQNGYDKYKDMFTYINPDVSEQYTEKVKVTKEYELKIRNQHCFQALFTANAIRKFRSKKENVCHVVDIGDSAGNHLKYLGALLKENGIQIEGISVNLDKNAVDKINANGGKAILSRAEDYCPEQDVQFYLSYEMMEHLHNPALFLHRLAKANKGQYIIFTVPYVKQSRVALRNSCSKSRKPITAEREHIFELSPEDWSKICLHSGWKVVEQQIYLQYPANMPIVSTICRKWWEKYDFEGFLGMVLKRDMSVANRYLDWEE